MTSTSMMERSFLSSLSEKKKVFLERLTLWVWWLMSVFLDAVELVFISSVELERRCLLVVWKAFWPSPGSIFTSYCVCCVILLCRNVFIWGDCFLFISERETSPENFSGNVALEKKTFAHWPVLVLLKRHQEMVGF